MLSLFPNTQCLSFTNTHTQVTITEGVGTLFFVFSFFLFFPGKFYDSGSCYYYYYSVVVVVVVVVVVCFVL